MVYVISDIHGCYDKYLKLLDRLNMSEKDSLYVLGDVVDRGDCGIRILLDLAKRKNVFSYRGNHDHCALTFLRNFCITNDGYGTDGLMEAFRLWLSDGGYTTYEEFLSVKRPEQLAALNYLNSMPLFEEIIINDQKFFLAHTVPEKEKMLQMDKCCLFDFIMGEPEYEQTYFDDTIIVSGHTPTGFIDPEYTGRIWKGNNHIAIDCGAVFGNPLGCICLDTMEEIYVE